MLRFLHTFKNSDVLKSMVVAFVAGACLALSTLSPYTAGFLLVGLFLLFKLIDTRGFSIRKLLVLSLVSGTLYMGVGFFWVLELHPLSWSGISNPVASLSLVMLVWLIIAFVQGASVGIWAVLVRLCRGCTPGMEGVVAASLWILSEKLRVFLLVALFYGNPSQFVPHLDFINAGYIAAQLNVFALLLPLGGSVLASWFAVLFSYVLYVSSKKERLLMFVSTAGVFLVLNQVLPLPNERITTAPLTVGVLTSDFAPDFSQSGITKRVREVHDVLAEIATPLDMVVLSENSFYLRRRIFTPFANSETDTHLPISLIVDSSMWSGGHDLYYYKPDTQTTETYSKIVLMPQGEYLMGWEVFFAKLFGFDDWLKSKQAIIAPRVGTEVVPFVLNKEVTVGGLLCAESASPYLFRDLVLKGATILVNPASYAVFDDSSLLSLQSKMIVRVRAIELDRYVVVSGNSTDSFIVSNQGEVVALVDPNQNLSIAIVEIFANKHQTLFARFGEWIVYVSFFILVLQFICLRKSLKK